MKQILEQVENNSPKYGDFYWTEESFNRVMESLEDNFVTVPSDLKTAEEIKVWLLSLEDE